MQLQSVQKAIAFLIANQNSNGSFDCMASSDESFKNSSLSPTPFITSLIVSSLHQLRTEKTCIPLFLKAQNFLLSQKSQYGSWNYWIRESTKSKIEPYPDDLDDTFSALSALFLINKKNIDGKVLANIVTLLSSLEVKVGGPYKTWIVPSGSAKIWKDVDIAVNANIGYFLSLCDIQLPALNIYYDKQIFDKNFTSPYYVSSNISKYFLARFYTGKYKKQLISQLASGRNTRGVWENPLETALCMSALLDLGVTTNELKPAYNYLLQMQKSNHWQAYPFINERIIKGNTIWAGSPFLTTAICIEALQKYNFHTKNAKLLIPANSKKQDKIVAHIVADVTSKFSVLDTILQKKALKLLNELIEKDPTKQIPLMPYYFSQTLPRDKQNLISKDLLIRLGVANVFGWIAYTIFDDFYDGDEHNPIYLVLAEFAARHMHVIFSEIGCKYKNFNPIFQSWIDRIDNANAWEMSHSRFDPDINDYSQIKLPAFKDMKVIADKSIGHGLGPVAIFTALGMRINNKNMIELHNFLTHFLIAKQLNDDAHDWEEDLKRGQLNPVNVLLLKKWKKSKKELPMKEYFWYEVSPEICDIIFQHINEAENALMKISLIENKTILSALLSPIRDATQKAVDERASMHEFLSSYHE